MKSSATPATPKPSQDPRALRVVGGGRGARGEGGDYQDWRGGAGETMGATEMGFLWRRDAYKYARVCSKKKTKAKFVRCSCMGKLCPHATASPKLLRRNAEAADYCAIGAEWGGEVIDKIGS